MSDFGYGQAGPNDSASRFNSIAFLVKQMIARLSTMTLVQVKGVHVDSPGLAGAAGTVDVLPLVSQIDGNGYAVPHGVVYGLPYFRLCGGANAVICDPEVDDLGYVVCASRDTSAVRAKRGAANPGSRRTFDLADGVYVGGVLCQTPTQYVAFSSTGIKLADKNGNVLQSGPSGWTFTGAVMANGVIVAGFGGVDQVSLQTHVHGGVTTGLGSTALPTPGT